MEGSQLSELITFTSSTTINATVLIAGEGNIRSAALSKELSKILSEVADNELLTGHEKVRALEQYILKASKQGSLPVSLSDEELLWVTESVRGRLDALCYLQSEQQRKYFSISVAYDCYALIYKYRSSDVEDAIRSLSANLRFVLHWLYNSLRAYADYGLKDETKAHLRSIPKDLRCEAFRIIENKIGKDTRSRSASIEVKSYLDILFEKI